MQLSEAVQKRILICEGLNMELTEFFADPLFEEVEYEED